MKKDDACTAGIFFLFNISKSVIECATELPPSVADEFHEHYARFCRYDACGVAVALVTESDRVLITDWRTPVPFLYEGFEATRREILNSVCFDLGVELPQDQSLDEQQGLYRLVSTIRDKLKQDFLSEDFETLGRACGDIRQLGCLMRSIVSDNSLDSNKPICPFSTDVQDPRIYLAYDLRWFQDTEEPCELGILVADFHM